jgi:hypothetical protein
VENKGKIMQSVKDKVAAHKDMLNDANILFTPEEVKYLHELFEQHEAKKVSKKESM